MSQIFISYSRRDIDFARRFVEEVTRSTGVAPWIDLKGIETGTQFTDVIVGAIDKCDIFIFLISKDSIDSMWVKKEVLYAKDCEKRIYPVIIDETSPSGWFRFEFGRIDCIAYNIPEQRSKLFVNLAESLGVNSPASVPKPKSSQEEGAEELFLSKVRRLKYNDGVIDARERQELDDTARRLGISILRAEALIESVECAFEEERKSVVQVARVIPPRSLNAEAESKQTCGENTVSECRYQVLAGTEVNRRDIEEAVELDNLSYPECYRGNIVDCVKWSQANPDIYVMLRDKTTSRIIAYINVMPVTDEWYDMIRSGKFIDVSISPEMILSYDMPLPYCIYFSSVVIHPAYRNTGVFKYLFNAILARFIELGKNEIFIKKMLADAESVEGEKFCKLFGMNKLDQSEHGSSLYEVSMIPPRFRVTSRMTKQLYDYYQAKYEESPYLFD